MPGDDIRQIRRISLEAGLTPQDRRAFGDYIEDCKRHGDHGSEPGGDFTEAELWERMDAFKQLLPRFRDRGQGE